MPLARVNGTALFYLRVGTGTPCLVMHGGLGWDHTYVHPSLDPLGEMLGLVYYDHRGNGRSGRPPLETLTFEQLAADADGLRTHLRSDTIDLIGHSFGGMIALHYALWYPERLRRLILLNTAPAWDYVEEIMANAKRKGATPEMLAALDMGTYTEDAQLRHGAATIAPLYYASFDPGRAGRLFARTIYSAEAVRRTGALLREYDLVSRLKEVTTPTLIVTGRDDFITPPSQAERLARGIPYSELVICERSGHFPFVEEPEFLFASIRRWLARPG